MTTRPVVSNTTPIISLARIGALDLLRGVFGTVLIPKAVAQELAGAPGVVPIPLAAYPWIAVQDVTVPPVIATGLDAGEAAAIALALEVCASLLLMDERIGRTRAVAHGVAIMGTLTVLARAKRQGLIPVVRPVSDALLANGFHASRAVVAEVLRQVGE